MTALNIVAEYELLPTPAVNDMGEGKTLEWWDEWAPRQKSSDGRPAPHGRSLAIEAQRLLPTPRSTDGPKGGPGQVNGRGVPDSLPAISALLPTPASQDGNAGGRRWTRADFAPTLWEVVTNHRGATTPPPSPDGNASSDDPHQHQLSLDELAHPD